MFYLDGGELYNFVVAARNVDGYLSSAESTNTSLSPELGKVYKCLLYMFIKLMLLESS